MMSRRQAGHSWGLHLVLAWLLGACAGWAAAEAPPATLVPGVLKWGADSQGGAPYVFDDPAHPSKLTGFETEIIAAIASHLGLRPEHIQNDWGSLPLGLQRGLYDIICNGLEITPEHKEALAFSIPYCITFCQLTVLESDATIVSLETCSGARVGTLKESLASHLLVETSRQLRQQGKAPIDVKFYDDEVNAFQDLGRGRLEAVFVDAPVAMYYAPSVPGLKFVGGEIGKMEYGIAALKHNAALIERINGVLQEMIRSGEMREIYLKWNLWNNLMAEAWRQPPPEESQADGADFARFMRDQRRMLKMDWAARLEIYTKSIPVLLKAALVTLELSVISMAVAVAFGFMLAMVRIYAPPPFSWLAVAYIELVRGTPLLIQLLFIFYGLPGVLGLDLTPFMAAIIGLGGNYAAYEAENYRAGLESVPRGQMEAARALGMRRRQALRYVVVPQAFRIVIPPVTNDFISLLKDSSLVSVITMVELTKVYQQLSIRYYDYFGIGILVAGMYLLLGLPFVALAHYTQRRLGAGRQTPFMQY